MPTLGQATTGLLALTAILVLTRSLSTMAGYNTREKLPLPRGDNARGCFWVVESLKVTNVP